MNEIPSEVIQHCQAYQGCSGCPIKPQCAQAITTTTRFDELMTAAVAAIRSQPLRNMSDREFVASIGLTEPVGGAA
jgi:hypothetical protein